MDPSKINQYGIMFNTPMFKDGKVTRYGLTMGAKDYKRMTNPIDWNSIASKGLGIFEGVADIGNTTKQLASLDRSAINNINSSIMSDINDEYSANDLYGLAAEANARVDLDPVDAASVGKKDAGQVVGGIGKGMLSGAQSGMAFGPWGALIGAAVGGLSTGAGAIANAINANKIAERLNEKIVSANNINDTKTTNQLNNIGMLDRNNIMANYAAYGGLLDDTFSNGVTMFNVGGTHESNPYGGIPQGMDKNGKPNFVEEGEVKYKDYIYSNRLKVSKKLLEENQLPVKYADKTYAEVADSLQQESKERPNDPISKNGLAIAMAKLAKAQETLKQEQQLDDVGSMFADGGGIHIDKNKKGTFTAAATKHNMGVQEFANHVLSHKNNFSPNMVKKANFARNAARWHANGGDLLRYASVLGNGVWSDLIGLTNKPSYENINVMDRYADSIPDVNTESIGISQQYTPTDYRPIINELSSQAAAARRAISNNNSPASAAQQTALNYNYNTGIGSLMQQYQQQELAKQNGVNAFNANIRSQDIANRANVAARNQAAAETRAKMHSDNAALREQIAAQAEASRAANMNALLEDLSNIGYEGTASDLVSWLANTGAFGPGIGNYKFINRSKE